MRAAEGGPFCIRILEAKLPATTFACFSSSQLPERGVCVTKGISPVTAVVVGGITQFLSGYLESLDGFIGDCLNGRDCRELLCVCVRCPWASVLLGWLARRRVSLVAHGFHARYCFFSWHHRESGGR
jgi:hypothetical protein